MPTDVAKGERRKAAIQRIHSAAQALTGSSIPLELPTRSQYGSDMLLIAQLETLAAYLEKVQHTPQKQVTPRRVTAKKGISAAKRKKEVTNG
jgi:hypothetical protein